MFFTVNQLSVSIQSMFFSPSVPNYGSCVRGLSGVVYEEVKGVGFVCVEEGGDGCSASGRYCSVWERGGG
jgi:hypothetical protein